MDSPLVQLTLSRLRELVREPGVLFWVFGFPILMSIGLGLAFRSRPPDPVRVAVLSAEPGRAEATVRALAGPGVVASAPSEEEALSSLRKAKVDVVLTLTASSASYRFDPVRAESRGARLVVDAALQRSAGRVDPLAASDVAVTEPGSRYIDFLLPGLIGLNLMGSSMWGIGYAVVDARARRLMKRFAATPMRRSHYLGSFILSRFLLLVVEVVSLVLFGALVFDVAVRGSWAALAAVSIAGSLGFAGIALLVAARPRKVEVASGWMNFVMMPMWLLSGAFFSYERFPELLHPLIRALPLTALIDGLRAVMNDGAGLLGVAPQLAVLGAWGVLGFALALATFRWQ